MYCEGGIVALMDIVSVPGFVNGRSLAPAGHCTGGGETGTVVVCADAVAPAMTPSATVATANRITDPAISAFSCFAALPRCASHVPCRRP